MEINFFQCHRLKLSQVFLVRLAVRKFFLLSVLSLDCHVLWLTLWRLGLYRTAFFSPSYQHTLTCTHAGVGVSHLCFLLNSPKLWCPFPQPRGCGAILTPAADHLVPQPLLCEEAPFYFPRLFCILLCELSFISWQWDGAPFSDSVWNLWVWRKTYQEYLLEMLASRGCCSSGSTGDKDPFPVSLSLSCHGQLWWKMEFRLKFRFFRLREMLKGFDSSLPLTRHWILIQNPHDGSCGKNVRRTMAWSGLSLKV